MLIRAAGGDVVKANDGPYMDSVLIFVFKLIDTASQRIAAGGLKRGIRRPSTRSTSRSPE